MQNFKPQDFNIPESIKSYFNDPGIQPAVDALVDKLDGKKMPETTWKEARDYNRALLMAAQVRADYIEMLFDLWGITFGAASAGNLGSEYFDWDEDPKAVWNEEKLGRTYYRDGQPEDEGQSDYLSVEASDTLHLSIRRWNDDDNRMNFPKSANISGWEIIPDEQFNLARTLPIPMKQFLNAPQDSLAKLQEAAKNMVAYLNNKITVGLSNQGQYQEK